MKTQEQKQEEAKKKREVLISLSRKARKIRDIRTQTAADIKEAAFWESRTINEMLFEILYRRGEAKDFKTFWQWKDEGKTIKKGEKAFLIWGQPIKAHHKTEAKPETETPDQDEEFKYWPICYLFSNLQVN